MLSRAGLTVRPRLVRCRLLLWCLWRWRGSLVGLMRGLRGRLWPLRARLSSQEGQERPIRVPLVLVPMSKCSTSSWGSLELWRGL